MSIFTKIFNDQDLDALNNTVRWNRLPRHVNESVAHHSFLVVLFTRIICEEINLHPEGTLSAVTHAIFHDFSEIFEGDVLHNVKYNNYNGEQIRKELEDYTKISAKAKFPGDSKGDSLFYNSISAPPSDFVKTIVKLADWLSMSFYCLKETRMGNTNFDKPLLYCDKGVNKTAALLHEKLDQNKAALYNPTILKELQEWTSKN